MTNDRIDQLISKEAKSYRNPGELPLDEIWERIEQDTFASGSTVPASERSRWRKGLWVVAGVAASLIVGFGLGRVSAPVQEAGVVAADTVSTDIEAQLQVATSEYFDDAEVLLAALSDGGFNSDSTFISDAVVMLARTRLFLDSSIGTDPLMRDVLEDLELVLVQLARLQTQNRPEDLTFIVAAMDERDVVPRLRHAATAFSYSDN